MNFVENTKPMIMGILNVTPDSFSDGGRFNGAAEALEQCRKMIEQGVDIIDIGGESTRPGADPVSAEEQIQRVVPIIDAIRLQLNETIPISIDTTLHRVAAAALDAGATLINDISAGLDDELIFDVAVQKQVPLILMHRQGTPKNMQESPSYVNVVREVLDGLMQRVEVAISRGLDKRQLLIDPGIGFGKRKQDNIDLLAHLDQFVATGYPVLLGTSRKRFMGSICDVNNPEELVTATAVTTALGVMNGVKCFRVHDVKENKQALDVAWAIYQSRHI